MELPRRVNFGEKNCEIVFCVRDGSHISASHLFARKCEWFECMIVWCWMFCDGTVEAEKVLYGPVESHIVGEKEESNMWVIMCESECEWKWIVDCECWWIWMESVWVQNVSEYGYEKEMNVIVKWEWIWMRCEWMWMWIVSECERMTMVVNESEWMKWFEVKCVWTNE